MPNNIIFICIESTKFVFTIPPFFKQDNRTLKMVARFCKWLPKLTRIVIISLDFKDYNKQGELQWTTACKAKNDTIFTNI
jgi:hypothetical protein